MGDDFVADAENKLIVGHCWAVTRHVQTLEDTKILPICQPTRVVKTEQQQGIYSADLTKIIGASVILAVQTAYLLPRQ